MEPDVLVALIAAFASLLIAIVTTVYNSARDRRNMIKQHQLEIELAQYRADLDQNALREQQALSARAELDRVREPLLAAAIDLADRIDNIRSRGFFFYLSDSNGDRRRIALTGTMYRFARYWCIVESLYDTVGLSKFTADDTTRSVASTLRAIGGAFASDGYDGRRLMMWREEQRAIAEKMRDDKSPIGCIGYATFSDRYEQRFSTWFASFERDLESAPASERMRVIQEQLSKLAEQLDTAGAFRYQWTKLMPGSAPTP